MGWVQNLVSLIKLGFLLSFQEEMLLNIFTNKDFQFLVKPVALLA